MTFGWEINLGHVITLALAVVGLIGGYVTLRVKAQDNEEKTKRLDTRVDAYGTALADLRLHVEATCVKRDDLERVEDRIGKRLDSIETGVRDIPTRIIAAMSGGRRNDDRPGFGG